MKIRTKILVGFLFATSLVIIVNIIGLNAFHSLRGAYHKVESETLPVIGVIQDIRFAAQRILTAANEYGFITSEIDRMHSGGGDTIGKEMAASLEKEEEELLKFASEDLLKALSRYQNLIHSYFPNRLEQIQEINKVMRHLEEGALHIITLKKQNAPGAEVLVAKEQLEKFEDDFLLTIDSMLLFEKNQFKDRDNEVRLLAETAVKEMFFVGLMIITLGVLASLLLADNLLRPINSMQKITKLVSQGFLNERVVVKSNDELSELAASLNQMIDSLEKNTKEIRTDTLQEEKEFAKAKNDLSEEKDRRQQAEKKQHQSENTFWALANNIGIGIALINQDMEVTGINTLMKKWFPDVNVEETPHCYQAFHNPPMQILCADCPVHSAFLDGKSHQRLTQMEIGNRKRDMQIISCPIFDEDGNIVNVIEMFGDITKKS